MAKKHGPLKGNNSVPLAETLRITRNALTTIEHLWDVHGGEAPFHMLARDIADEIGHFGQDRPESAFFHEFAAALRTLSRLNEPGPEVENARKQEIVDRIRIMALRPVDPTEPDGEK